MHRARRRRSSRVAARSPRAARAGPDTVRAEEAPRRGDDQGRGDAHGQVPAHWTAPARRRPVVSDNWIATFGDEQLTAAVAEAIAHNADLRVGAARVEQAMLYAKLAGAKLYPSVDLLARGGGKMSGDGRGLQGGC